MSRTEPKVFEQGPLSDIADGYVELAFGMMNNGTFYDIEPPQEGTLLVNPYGRNSKRIEISEITDNTDGTATMLASFCIDWLEAEPGNIGGDEPYATSLIFDTSTVHQDGEFVTTELLAVDVGNLEVTLKDVIVAAMSTAYLAGRADQIADILGTNDRRLVRHKNLRPVMDLAASPFAGTIFEDFTSNPRQVLGQMKNLLGVLKDNTDELRIDYARAPEEGFIGMPDFITPLTLVIKESEANEN